MRSIRILQYGLNVNRVSLNMLLLYLICLSQTWQRIEHDRTGINIFYTSFSDVLYDRVILLTIP